MQRPHGSALPCRILIGPRVSTLRARPRRGRSSSKGRGCIGPRATSPAALCYPRTPDSHTPQSGSLLAALDVHPRVAMQILLTAGHQISVWRAPLLVHQFPGIAVWTGWRAGIRGKIVALGWRPAGSWSGPGSR
jgi:hypothetical protein